MEFHQEVKISLMGIIAKYDWLIVTYPPASDVQWNGPQSSKNICTFHSIDVNNK